MTIFDSPENLAENLRESGVRCAVSGSFVEVPCAEAELTATLQIVEGWLVFKAYLGEWAADQNGLGTLLRLQDRLIGIRFSVVDGELWALQDFPVNALGAGFHTFIEHVDWVLATMLPTLRLHLDQRQSMREEDIDAMFERFESHHLN